MSSEHTEISAIVTYYNQPFDDLLFTLSSCVLQKGVDFDIVVADDCSNRDYHEDIERFFAFTGFSNYEIVRQPQNVKTVGNILSALGVSKGKYIKTIGSEDAFFSERTLRDVVDYCIDNDCQLGFGKCCAFQKRDGDYTCGEFEAPRNKQSYLEPKPPRRILEQQLINADWIPGGAQFFEKGLFEQLLAVLQHDYGIKYCEDFAATIALCDPDSRIGFLDEFLIYYAVGSGISTSSAQTRPYAIYADHQSLYGKIGKRNPYGMAFRRARTLFALRKFVALRTPVYHKLRKREFESRSRNDDGRSCDLVGDFFFRCMGLAEAYMRSS